MGIGLQILRNFKELNKQLPIKRGSEWHTPVIRLGFIIYLFSNYRTHTCSPFKTGDCSTLRFGRKTHNS